MIVKITVKDNDFSDLLVDFCKNFWTYIVLGMDENDFEFDRHIRFRNMLNPNEERELTSDEKFALLKRIEDAFRQYITARKSEDTVKYLMKHLTISIQNSFTDRWENGEAVYWLQHSGVVVNQ